MDIQRARRNVMVIGLTWIQSGNRAISNEQLITYQDNGNVTALPPVQFVVTSEQSDFGDWHPAICFFIGTVAILWRTFRTQPTQELAFEYAKNQVENALRGSFEDGQVYHWRLNEWAFELAKNLKLVEIGT